jgi:putative spermidine/putrescine transport system ATP-binding protein
MNDRRVMAGVQGADQLVVFDGVQKSYDGSTLVVRDLNLAVRRGEFLTMLGPSGSGKTTTLMMLGGFERPTAGHILLDGKPVEALPPEKRDIGFVFQNYALFPHMSVAENVAFPLRYRGVRGDAAKQRVVKALSMVRLDGFDSRKPSQLSGGQQQRVALARALVFQPKLVLMDEPLGALDKQLRERMQIEIKHLQQTLGITIVFVTHDQSEALTMSDRVAVFHDGVLQQLATPRALYDAPGNAFVAGFVGENNLLPCTVALNGTAAALVAGTAVPGVLPHPLRHGSNAVLAIRPERIGLTQVGAAGSVRCVISEAFFLGDHTRVDAEVAAFGGASVTIKLPPSTPVPPPGIAAGLVLPAEHCRIIAP